MQVTISAGSSKTFWRPCHQSGSFGARQMEPFSGTRGDGAATNHWMTALEKTLRQSEKLGQTLGRKP